MPTLASLTRSLTLPLNRKHRQRSNTTNDQPEHTPESIQFSVSHPPPRPRRHNSYLEKLAASNVNGLARSNTLKSPQTPTAESSFVVPPYQGPANAGPQGVVFGKPLKESLKYASVQISTANSNGELYVWGYIPVVVAKCGLYLKENATEVPGTFRVNGSSKRMRILQETFETPPRYGKNLDWKQEQYTTHDVASVFRRYLTQMPEPVIPYDLYHQFRDVLAKEPYNQEEVIAKYKSLMRQMPRANQYLLLYVLDLLSVFARKSDINLMTATNLAVIFRPGLISHPNHEMSPPEHALSQKVLEFLIAHQDWFMLDIP
ncbi:Rho GTPase activation protein, partial [Coprinopsis marcescibilis]